MYQRHARALYAQGAAGVGHIAHHGCALHGGREGYHGHIAHEEELVVAGHLHHREMRHHSAGGQQAVLLVEHGAQQIVGIDEALHEHVGAALAHIGHGGARSLVGIGALHHGATRRIVAQRGGERRGRLAVEAACDYTQAQAAGYRLDGSLVVGTHDCHTHGCGGLGEKSGDHCIKVANRAHDDTFFRILCKYRHFSTHVQYV